MIRFQTLWRNGNGKNWRYLSLLFRRKKQFCWKNRKYFDFSKIPLFLIAHLRSAVTPIGNPFWIELRPLHRAMKYIWPLKEYCEERDGSVFLVFRKFGL